MTHQAEDAAARRRNIETLLPLAPLQEGILFHCLAAPDASGVYMPQMAYHLRGPLDAAALRAAWEKLLARHPALRSGVHWEERDTPFQVVYRRLDLPWSVSDWRGEDAEAALRALFAANRAAPFDLRRPPLLRVHLARTGEDQHVLTLCHHHIILDGWSGARMLEDLMILYRGGDLPAARPYADYIRWLKSRDAEASEAFWRDYLEDAPGPAIAFGGAGEAPEFIRREWAFPGDLPQRVSAFCTAQGVTLNTLLQGVLGLAVAERLGRDDVLFGAATSGRPADLPGAAGIVGLFINALPVRARIDRDETVAAYLARMQAQQARAMAHEHVALRRIQQGWGTLFDCLLVVENYPVALGGAGGGIALDKVEFDEWTHFPLTLLVAPGHAGMKLILRHDRATLPEPELESFLNRFADLLTRVVDAPLARAASLVGPLAPAAPLARQEAAASETVAARPPEADSERRVAAVWSELLRREGLKANDNFFALGGHSLMAAKAVARLRNELEVDLAVRALFERPVLADFARHLDALRAAAPACAEAAEGETVVEF